MEKISGNTIRGRRPPVSKASSRQGGSCIRRAVIDQTGGRWFQCGSGDALSWASLAEIQAKLPIVLERFGLRGIPLATAEAKREFLQEVQQYDPPATGAVATQTGWIDSAFVFGDGTMAQSDKKSGREVLAVFDEEPKFRPRGKLDRYNKSLTPLIVGQSLPMAVMAFAFVGPLLKFAPSHIAENPLLEISGPKQSGKTTLAIMAMSAWAGEFGSSVGGGDTWNTTDGSIDEHKRLHSDCLLYFDEGSLDQTGGQFTLRTIWSLSTSQSRRRMGARRAQPIKVAFLSTTNIPLGELSGKKDAKVEAMLSRMVTLKVKEGSNLGVFDFVPKGRKDSKDAIRALKAVVTETYGVAARAYVEYLVNRVAEGGSDDLRDEIKARIDLFERESGAAGNTDDRIANTFALMYAAARLARSAGVLPNAWRGIRRLLIALYREQAGKMTPATDQIRSYFDRNKGVFTRVEDTEKLSVEKFEASAGFIRTRHKKTELIIPAKMFRKQFADADAILEELKRSGQLDCERQRYTRHVPRSICDEGKVHIIRMSLPE